MTIQELDKKFYFHDSVINNIKYAAEEKKLEILMELCY